MVSRSFGRCVGAVPRDVTLACLACASHLRMGHVAVEDRQRRFSTAAIASFVTYPDARTARGRDVRETSTERLLRIDRFAARGDPPPPSPLPRARARARHASQTFPHWQRAVLRALACWSFFFCGALACSGAISFGHGTWERKKLLITITFIFCYYLHISSPWRHSAYWLARQIFGQPSPVRLGRDAGKPARRRSSVPERPPAAAAMPCARIN